MTSLETTPVKVSDVPSTFGEKVRAKFSVTTITTLGLFIGIVVVGGLTTPSFLTIGTFNSVILASAFVGIIAVGMTLIMLCGRLFSMALGTTAAVGAITFLLGLQLGLFAAIVLTVLITAIIGWIQGFVVGTLNANPIIVTIAAGVVLTGLALFITDGMTVMPPPNAVGLDFLNSRPLGLPISFLVFVILVVIVELILRFTRFGQQTYAVGENRFAAEAAAISVPRVTAMSFAIASACAGIAGILLAAFNRNATLVIEGSYNFDAIAAVLVGGSLVTGGKGSALRTFFGALLIAMLSSLLLIRGYSTGLQLLIKGIIVLGVVCIVHIGTKGGKR